MRLTPILILALLTTACRPGPSDGDSADEPPFFGDGTFELTVIADSGDGLGEPRDLAFHPDRDGELWIINRDTESITFITDAGTEDAVSETRGAQGNAHFLAQPSALAFSRDNGNLATSHETDELTQGPPPFGTPEDFMGPTLWSSDPGIFDGGHGGHLDMLHNSPLGMGIAWEEDNTFWVFDGYHDSLSRYAFNSDHGPGGADHSDGEVLRFVEGEVSRVADVPSHIEVDAVEGLLYVADTGNSRIAVLDIDSGDVGDFVGPDYDGGSQREATGADLSTLIDGTEHGLDAPSGLAIHDGVLFVGDNDDGTLYAFDLDGELLDSLELGIEAGAMMGIEAAPDGTLFVVDSAADEVLRLDL